MGAPPYERQRDSGCEVFGIVPDHWNVCRLKNFADVIMGQSPDSNDCNNEAIGPGFLQGNADFGEKSPVARSYCPVATKFAQPSDILLSVRAPVGAINIADHVYGIGRGLCAIRAHDPHSARFLYYCLFLIRESLLSIAAGSTYEAVTVDQVANAVCLAPPITEQSAIATFLDRETAKIDALVAEQRRLIALLKEKRQAVISHAVTKGLNPDAPMKDSGIEWLGEVPEHWEVVAVKHLAMLNSGDGITADSIDATGVYPVFGGNGLRGFTNAYTHDGHYVIIGRQGALCGNVNFGEGKFWASEHAVVATSLRNINTVWLGEMIRSMNLNQYSETAAQPGLSMAAVGNLRTVFPHIEEQQHIAEFVRKKSTEFDSLSEQAERAIELLQERRTALISAAVTGKIDVREYALQETA